MSSSESDPADDAGTDCTDGSRQLSGSVTAASCTSARLSKVRNLI